MTSFAEGDENRPDYALMQNGATTLFFRPALHLQSERWLASAGYRVERIDPSSRTTFQADMTRVLRFRENFGYEPWNGGLDALNDAFHCVSFDGVTGVALSLARFDRLSTSEPAFALGVLDIFEGASRSALLRGHRLLALVQTDDPRAQFHPLGARAAHWNHAEWLDSSRIIGST